MPKLQRIKRSNGSLVFFVNIPLEVIEILEWQKGIDLFLEIKDNKAIIIFKSGDEINK